MQWYQLTHIGYTYEVGQILNEKRHAVLFNIYYLDNQQFNCVFFLIRSETFQKSCNLEDGTKRSLLSLTESNCGYYCHMIQY